MDASLYGNLSVALNTIGIASIFIIFGTDSGAKRFIPILNKNNMDRNYISWNLKYFKKNSIILIFITVTILLLFILLYYLNIHDFDALHLAVFIIILTPIFAFSELINAFFNSQNFVLFSSIFKSIFSIMITWLVFFIALELLYIKLNIYNIVIIFAIIYTILSTFSYIIYSKLNQSISLFRLMFEKTKDSSNDNTEWKEFTNQLGKGSLIFIFLSYINIVILEIMHTKEAIIGHFAVVIMLAGFLLLVSKSVYKMVLPNISKLLENTKNHNKLQNIISRANKFSFLISFLILIFYIVFGHSILDSFKGDYTDMYNILIIFTLSQLIMVLKLGSTNLLRYAGYAKFIVDIETRSVFLLIVFGTIFTYLFGIIGLVGVNVIVNTYMLLMFTIEAKKKYPNINTFGLRRYYEKKI